MGLLYPREWLVIANRALNLIGSPPMQTLDNSSAASQNVNIQLAAAVQEVLAFHPFRCARKRASLASVAEPPAFGYDYAYQLPSDCCSVVEVLSGGVVLSEGDYVIEGDKILSDMSEMCAVYTELPSDPRTLTPSVQGTIEYLLAYKLAQTTTSNDALISRLYQEYQSRLSLSKRSDNAGCGDAGGERLWTEDR